MQIQFEILGLSFESTCEKGYKGCYQTVVSKKTWKSLKERLKNATCITNAITFNERILKINRIQRGWLEYFRGANIKGKR
jgi:hypothetical protein